VGSRGDKQDKRNGQSQQTQTLANELADSHLPATAVALAPFSSKVSDAQKLAQSALRAAAAGVMCTALTIQMPACGNRNVTCPLASVRAVVFAAGFARFIATTSAPGSGCPS